MYTTIKYTTLTIYIDIYRNLYNNYNDLTQKEYMYIMCLS